MPRALETASRIHVGLRAPHTEKDTLHSGKHYLTKEANESECFYSLSLTAPSKNRQVSQVFNFMIAPFIRLYAIYSNPFSSHAHPHAHIHTHTKLRFLLKTQNRDVFFGSFNIDRISINTPFFKVSPFVVFMNVTQREFFCFFYTTHRQLPDLRRIYVQSFHMPCYVFRKKNKRNDLPGRRVTSTMRVAHACGCRETCTPRYK